MQVANTLNNSIRILFNPKLEPFKLFDFLIVKSEAEKYVAQITQIYDDKFDASQNVAKLRLFYKITENNEVMPYDNFTPNKECEIIKIKQEEIETFINQEKETFIFGTNVKNQTSLNIQYDFFNNAPVVLADKIENANVISLNLAKNLQGKKNVVIIDSTGILEYQDAKKIKACENFKMPLNYETIDYVFEKCLTDASLEFQATGMQILNEIKKFARKQENEFIPFNAFTRVIMEQYKVTPYAELKLLLARLKKLQMDEIFARSKKDKDTLFNTISKNKITILDLSSVSSYWQKAYLEYIISELKDEVYLISRINDENFDVDLINKTYCSKKNIKFIPNVSYNYKKLPSLMQFCKNYVLMPSLYQRNDFLDANFALSTLISDGCIIFGENTDNFLYQVQDLELEQQEKRKNYRKIALTLVQKDQEAQQNLGKMGDYFENKEKEEKLNDSQRLIEELSEFDALRRGEFKTIEEPQEDFEELENPIQEEQNYVQVQDAQQEVQEPQYHTDSGNLTEVDEFQDLVDTSAINNVEQTDSVEEEVGENAEEILQNLNKEEEIFETKEEVEEPVEVKPAQEEVKAKATIIQDEIEEELVATDEPVSLNNETEEQNLETESDEIAFSDEELDFFQIAQDSSDEFDSIEETEKESDDIDLSEVAETSIDNSFEQIVNSKKEQNDDDLIALDDNTKIDANILNQPTKEEGLPIFKEEKEEQDTFVYEIGNVIIHKKYGRGTVVKTIKYEERQLLQIEFDESGKKLLDPKVADIKLEQ